MKNKEWDLLSVFGAGFVRWGPVGAMVLACVMFVHIPDEHTSEPSSLIPDRTPARFENVPNTS